MMKKYFLLLVIIISAYSSKAQLWCNAGAEWHYEYNAYFPETHGYVKGTHQSDTTINSITYHIIKHSGYSYSFMASMQYTAGAWSGPNNLIASTIYLNESNKLITLHNGTTNDTLFNFAANIGDKWLRVRTGEVSNDFTRRYVTVLDTSHTIVNGFNLKTLVLQYQHGGYASAPIQTYNDTVYEKIGSLIYFLNPARFESNIMLTDYIDNSAYSFRCYSDNSFGFYHKPNALNCTDIVGIEDTNSLLEKSVNIYPNPTNAHVIIHSTETVNNIALYNELGEIIRLNNNTHNNSINMDSLANGIYFIEINTIKGMVRKKIIKL